MADKSDGTTTFILCQLRLELALGASRGSGDGWAARIAGAIRAALELVDADGMLGRVLTTPAANRRREPDPQFTAMVDHLAELWLRGAPPIPNPKRAARVHIMRIARQVLLHLEMRPQSAVTEIAPDLIVLTLTPYVGLTEARRRAGG